MDADIKDIRRRAGLNEETFDMASHEKLMKFLNDEIDFLEKVGKVVASIAAPDNARKLLSILGDRRQRLQQFGRQAQAQARQEGSKEGSGPQAQRRGQSNPYSSSGGVGGNVDTRV